MSLRVLGVGLGLFIVLLLWAIALILCVLFWKSKGAAGYLGIGFSSIALLITVILIVIPKTPENSTPTKEIKVYDDLFIARICIAVLMGVFALVSFALFFVTHLLSPVCAVPVKSIK